MSNFKQIHYSLNAKWNILFENSTEWISFQPKPGLEVYPCFTCKSMFSNRTTFVEHVNRRAICIQYHCMYCPNTLTFYNRCALLLHTRMHYQKYKARIQLDQVDIQPLPLNIQLGFDQANNDLDSTWTKGGLNATEDDTLLNCQFYRPDEADHGKATVNMVPFNLHFYYVPSSSNSSTDEQQPVPLVLRQMRRDATIPMCCFQKYSETNGILTVPCPECRVLVPASRHHFGSLNPVQFSRWYRCECGYILPTQCALMAHKRLHLNCGPYICPECGIRFECDVLLRMHMDTVCHHGSKQIRYKCPAINCVKLFTTETVLSQHLTVEHVRKSNSLEDKNGAWCQMCQPNRRLTRDTQKTHIAEHMKRTRIELVYMYVCSMCNCTYRTLSSYKVHRNGCRERINTERSPKCTRCGFRFSSALMCRRCPKCSGTIYFVRQQFDEVNSEDEDDNVSSLVCILCKKVVLSKNNNHLEECQQLKRRTLKRKDISRALQVPLKKLSKRHPVGKNHVSDKKLAIDGSIPYSLGRYTCLLCTYKFTDRNEFHKHIVKHRDVLTAYQCMECGACFVVKPSLEKHLKIYHKINDTDAYIEQSDCYNPKAVAQCKNSAKLCVSEHTGPLKQNQCTVCLKQFSDKNKLNEHFRTHGLAFLMRKNSK